MIEIVRYEEHEKVANLYNEVKNIILSKKDNKNFYYNHKQHHLYEESECPGISKDYYNESGSVEFENVNGKMIRLEIRRWHPHKHNGCSGLGGTPCLTAVIYTMENEKKHVLWELNAKPGTLYYKAEVSSLEIPYDILKEKQNINENAVMGMKEDEIEGQSQIIEPQETRILFDEIMNLYNKYKSAEKNREELLLERKKEIDEATEKIIESYSIKLTQNDDDITSIKKELNNFDKFFAKYSTFDMDLVGKAIQQLISVVESEEYLYELVIHEFKKREYGVMDSWDTCIQTKVRIVVRKDKFMNCYDSSCKSESKINELVKNGDALLLSEQYNNKKITFYTSQDGQVLCHFDFGRFDYIKEFIDSIVQYRFQNNMVEFTEKDMLSFMKNFVIGHEDIIMKNYNSRIKEKLLSLRLDIS